MGLLSRRAIVLDIGGIFMGWAGKVKVEHK